jgi:hypothetical protein
MNVEEYFGTLSSALKESDHYRTVVSSHQVIQIYDAEDLNMQYRVNENSILVGYDAATLGNQVPTFRRSVLSSS